MIHENYFVNLVRLMMIQEEAANGNDNKLSVRRPDSVAGITVLLRPQLLELQRTARDPRGDQVRPAHSPASHGQRMMFRRAAAHDGCAATPLDGNVVVRFDCTTASFYPPLPSFGVWALA